MKKEEFREEIEKIQSDYINYQDLTKNRINNLFILAGEELGNYFVSKGFVHVREKEKKRDFKIGIQFPDGTIDEESDEEFNAEINKPDVYNNYYYDPKTRVGIEIGIPDYIDLERDFNSSIHIFIVYKVGSRFLQHQKNMYYYYTSELPEKFFIRFKKYNGKAESTRMKEYLKKTYPDLAKNMLQADRSQKIKTIKNKE